MKIVEKDLRAGAHFAAGMKNRDTPYLIAVVLHALAWLQPNMPQ